MNCQICGKYIDHETYVCGPEMIKHQLCFTCNFWQNQLEADKERGDYKWAIIDGGHYVIAPEDEKTRFRGFDGQKFIIIFNDGTVVRTTNLWFQGHIPPEWKSQFPDNAVFADNRKWQKIGDCEYLAPSISTTLRGFCGAEATIRTMVKLHLEAQLSLCDEKAPSYLKENGAKAADNLQYAAVTLICYKPPIVSRLCYLTIYNECNLQNSIKTSASRLPTSLRDNCRYNEIWCNGSTQHFGCCSIGPNPVISTHFVMMLKVNRLLCLLNSVKIIS